MSVVAPTADIQSQRSEMTRSARKRHRALLEMKEAAD
jgi:hypothetical protein